MALHSEMTSSSFEWLFTRYSSFQRIWLLLWSSPGCHRSRGLLSQTFSEALSEPLTRKSSSSIAFSLRRVFLKLGTSLSYSLASCQNGSLQSPLSSDWEPRCCSFEVRMRVDVWVWTCCMECRVPSSLKLHSTGIATSPSKLSAYLSLLAMSKYFGHSASPLGHSRMWLCCASSLATPSLWFWTVSWLHRPWIHHSFKIVPTLLAVLDLCLVVSYPSLQTCVLKLVVASLFPSFRALYASSWLMWRRCRSQQSLWSF